MGLLSSSGQQVREGTALGQKAPPLAGTDLTGKRLSLGGLPGGFVMLTFWTPECLLCLKELPVYDSYYRNVGPKKLRLVGVLLDRDLSKDEVRTLVNKRGYSFPVVSFTGRDRLQVMKDWKVVATPTNYLVNPEGVIVLKDFFGTEGMALVQKIVDKQPDFVPPEMDLETTLTVGGQMMSYRVTIPEASGRYSFRFRSAAQYVDETGERSGFEEIAPVTLSLAKDARGVLVAEAALENKDITGKPAKLSNSSLVRVGAKRIGHTVYLEVDLPLPARAPLVLAEVKYYSEPLNAYIVLDSGYPS